MCRQRLAELDRAAEPIRLRLIVKLSFDFNLSGSLAENDSSPPSWHLSEKKFTYWSKKIRGRKKSNVIELGINNLTI